MEYTEKEILSQQNRIQTATSASSTAAASSCHCHYCSQHYRQRQRQRQRHRQRHRRHRRRRRRRRRRRPPPPPPPPPPPSLSPRAPCLRARDITSTGCPAQVKDNPEKDEHDVKKQEEVLAEYLGARVDEFERLKDFTGKLKEFMVRPRPGPLP